MYAENEPAMKRNETVNDLPAELYKIEANGKFQIIVNTHGINSSSSKSKANKEDFVKLLKLKLSAKVMLTANIG